MADSRLSRPVGLPIGPNGKLIQGTLLMNNNGDAEWFQQGIAAPSFISNASDNFTWKPSPGTTVPESQRNSFYATPTSVTTLNNARLQTWNSPTGYNSSQLAKQLNIPGANTATTSPQQPQQGGNPPAALDLPPAGQTTADIKTEGTPLANEQQLEIAPRGSRIQYPRLMKPDQDKIKFTACKIKPRTASGEGLGFKFGEPTYEVVAGSVFLAIQSSISDQNSVDWGPDTVSAIDAALFKASYDLIKPDDIYPTGAENNLKEAYKVMMGNTDRIKRFLAGQAAGINNVLARTDNIVLNPNLELLFQGPQLRPFTFQFKMSARNKQEADNIKAIIKYFKYHMAVRQEADKLFLRAPHVFTIQYLKGETPQHPGLNIISPSDDKKACALTNCSVDYTPLGSYMTYEDGTMTAYTLSLQFQELTPIYDTDYTESQSIGY